MLSKSSICPANDNDDEKCQYYIRLHSNIVLLLEYAKKYRIIQLYNIIFQ